MRDYTITEYNSFFFDQFHCVDPSSSFAKNEIFYGYHVERIFYPIINCNALVLDNIINLLNHLVDICMGNGGWGVDFIKDGLEITKQLIIVREPESAEIVCYIRHDIYQDISFTPHGFARYKLKMIKAQGFVNKLIEKLIFEELDVIKSKNNPESKLTLIIRTFNPQVYFSESKTFGGLYPNILTFSQKLNKAIKRIVSNVGATKYEELRQLFKDEILLWRSVSRVSFSNEELAEVISNSIDVSFNLRKLKILQTANYKYSLLGSRIYRCASILYKRSAPLKYRTIITEILNNSCHVVAHSFWGVKSHENYVPQERINSTGDLIVDDFFYGVANILNADVYLFCKDIEVR